MSEVSLHRSCPASSVLRACPLPQTAQLGPHGLPVGGFDPPRLGFPVLRHISSYTHAVATTPAESLDAYIALFSNDSGLPWFTGRSASALHFSRPAQRSLTLRPACSPSRPRRPSTPEASEASSPPPLLRLLPAGATFAGWDSHPLKMCALPRRTANRAVK